MQQAPPRFAAKWREIMQLTANLPAK